MLTCRNQSLRNFFNTVFHGDRPLSAKQTMAYRPNMDEVLRRTLAEATPRHFGQTRNERPANRSPSTQSAIDSPATTRDRHRREPPPSPSAHGKHQRRSERKHNAPHSTSYTVNCDGTIDAIRVGRKRHPNVADRVHLCF